MSLNRPRWRTFHHLSAPTHRTRSDDSWLLGRILITQGIPPHRVGAPEKEEARTQTCEYCNVCTPPSPYRRGFCKPVGCTSLGAPVRLWLHQYIIQPLSKPCPADAPDRRVTPRLYSTFSTAFTCADTSFPKTASAPLGKCLAPAASSNTLWISYLLICLSSARTLTEQQDDNNLDAIRLTSPI